MSDDRAGGYGLKEHEKFWAFIILIAAVVGLVLLAAGFDKQAPSNVPDLVMAGKLRIIDSAIAGLIAITGMAAQALFRVSSTDRLVAQTALETAKKQNGQSSGAAEQLGHAVEEGARVGTKEGVEEALAPDRRNEE